MILPQAKTVGGSGGKSGSMIVVDPARNRFPSNPLPAPASSPAAAAAGAANGGATSISPTIQERMRTFTHA